MVPERPDKIKVPRFWDPNARVMTRARQHNRRACKIMTKDLRGSQSALHDGPHMPVVASMELPIGDEVVQPLREALRAQQRPIKH